MMLVSWAVTACGNKGDLFLPADAQLEQQLDNVSEQIGEGTPSINGTQAPLPEDDDVPGNIDNDITDEVNDTDEPAPVKKKP